MDILTKNIIEKAFSLEDKLINIRRYIHKNAEVGYNTVKTSAFIEDKLKELNIKYRTIKDTGIVADIGNGEKTLLLRADIDALPMYETNNLEFKSDKEISHCCGHDLHGTMLLGAAEILKANEDKLNGKIRLMFQPDEEGGMGAKTMLDNGLLDDLKINAVMAMHVDAKSPLGRLEYGYGKTFASNDSFEIEIKGEGGHGARAYETIDPINIAFQIYNGLTAVINREVDPFNHILFSITSIDAVSNFNIIKDNVVMKGTLRTFGEEQRIEILSRFKTVVENIASAFNGEANFNVVKSLPALETSKEFTDEILEIVNELNEHISIGDTPVVKRGSEDFSYITEKIKNNAYLFIGAGKNNKEGFEYGQHNSNVIFNEKVLPLGSAVLSLSAMKWLNK